MESSTERSWSTKGWAVLIAGAILAEFRALHTQRNESTLSHATRTVFRTDCKVGRVAFCASWLALSVWYVPHVIKEVLREEVLHTRA